MSFKKIIFFIFIIIGGIFLITDKEKAIDPEELLQRKLFPNEDYFMDKQFPTEEFSWQGYQEALQSIYRWKQDKNLRSTGNWVVEGPGNIGARVNTLAVHPNNPGIILAGFSEGGIFKTVNGGTTWYPVFDDKQKLSIGDITFDPKNPSIVYAGTGDPNISGYPFVGNGLFKSMDGGETWSYSGLAEVGIISQIRVSRTQPDVLYASAMGLPFLKHQNRGLYKSEDAGNSWAKILFVNDSTGIIDLALDPRNDNVIYAVAWNRIRNNSKSLVSGPDGKIYKSIDGGDHWEILQGGLPDGPVSRIGIDISQSNPDILYATYTHANSYDLQAVYKTMNGGSTWEELPVFSSSNSLPTGMYGGFGWYFGKIIVNPKNPNDVFILGVDCFRSRDGGFEWEQAVPPWWTYEVHADKHDVVFSPSEILLATDGGIYATDIAQTQLWRDIENIPATQFYRVAVNPHQPDLYYGGAQDNGSTGGNAQTMNEWERIYGGDGFQMAFHQEVPEVYYASTQNGNIVVTQDGGDSYESANDGIDNSDPRNWDMPYMISSHHTERLYAGTDKIYRSQSGYIPFWEAISPVLTDSASNALRKNISALHESPVQEDYLYAGTSDGLLWHSQDFGLSWQRINQGLPARYVTAVVASPDDAETVFVSFSGYRDNDNTPYIYISDDRGQHWQSMQGDLPSIAINSLLILPGYHNKVIFAATDGGVFYTKNKGKNWFYLGDNMPSVAVYHLGYNPFTQKLIAGTYGRSIQSFDLNQIDFTSGISNPNLASDFTIYPTLTCDVLYVQDENQGLHKPRNGYIMNSNGGIIKQFIMTGKNLEVNISSLPSGKYYISLYNSDGVFCKTFLKF